MSAASAVAAVYSEMPAAMRNADMPQLDLTFLHMLQQSPVSKACS